MNYADIKKGFHTTSESEHGIYFSNHNVAKQDRMTTTQMESNFWLIQIYTEKKKSYISP